MAHQTFKDNATKQRAVAYFAAFPAVEAAPRPAPAVPPAPPVVFGVVEVAPPPRPAPVAAPPPAAAGFFGRGVGTLPFLCAGGGGGTSLKSVYVEGALLAVVAE
jgi:hypothetical protein